MTNHLPTTAIVPEHQQRFSPRHPSQHIPTTSRTI